MYEKATKRTAAGSPLDLEMAMPEFTVRKAIPSTDNPPALAFAGAGAAGFAESRSRDAIFAASAVFMTRVERRLK